MIIDGCERELFQYMTARRFDIITPMEEYGYIPPVAFESKELLLEWAGKHGLKDSPIGRIKPHNAVLIEEELFPYPGASSGLFYSQIWVSAKYKGYRRALKRDVRNYVEDENIISRVDADHVVNKNSASNLDSVWINLLPVWKTVNRGFGWIEAKLPKLEKGFGVISLPPLVAFKILRDKERFRHGDNRTREIKLIDYIDEVSSQLLDHDSDININKKLEKFRFSIRSDVMSAYNYAK